jgi:hypothetical protein
MSNGCGDIDNLVQGPYNVLEDKSFPKTLEVFARHFWDQVGQVWYRKSLPKAFYETSKVWIRSMENSC